MLLLLPGESYFLPRDTTYQIMHYLWDTFIAWRTQQRQQNWLLSQKSNPSQKADSRLKIYVMKFLKVSHTQAPKRHMQPPAVNMIFSLIAGQQSDTATTPLTPLLCISRGAHTICKFHEHGKCVFALPCSCPALIALLGFLCCCFSVTQGEMQWSWYMHQQNHKGFQLQDPLQQVNSTWKSLMDEIQKAPKNTEATKN